MNFADVQYYDGSVVTIVEAMSRLVNMYRNNCFCIISASRVKFDERVNRLRSVNLKNDLNARNMGSYQLVGHGFEVPEGEDYEECKAHAPEKIISTVETSYFVPKPKSMEDDAFFEIMAELAAKYGQDSVLIGRKGMIHSMDRTGALSPFGEKITFSKISQFYSEYIRGKNTPFVIEGIRHPNNLIDKQVMARQGLKWLTNDVIVEEDEKKFGQLRSEIKPKTMMTLYHFTPQQNILGKSWPPKEILLTPKHFGKHQWTRGDAEVSKTPRIFFYATLKNYEANRFSSHTLFTAKVDKSEVYDLSKDPDGLKSKFDNFNSIFRQVIRKGYNGAMYKVNGMNIVVWFKPIKVTLARKAKI